MPRSLWVRWRGARLGLSFYAVVLLGIAWGIPQAVGQLLDNSRGIPDWLRVVLCAFWGVAMLVLCPLAFEWLTRKFGITMGDKETGSSQGQIEEPRVAVLDSGRGKKRCGGCGAIANVYAVRCHQCKVVVCRVGQEQSSRLNQSPQQTGHRGIWVPEYYHPRCRGSDRTSATGNGATPNECATADRHCEDAGRRRQGPAGNG